MPKLSDFTVTDITGNRAQLSQYAGQVALVVNTASKCGFTPQFAGLQELYSTYKAKGFVVLGFPCNQFLHQEPGSSEDIDSFCKTNYAVNFPMFEKIDVNGPAADPLYTWIRAEAPGILGSTPIKWNFTKFLVDRDGQPVVRYAPTMEPKNIAPTIERLLGSGR